MFLRQNLQRANPETVTCQTTYWAETSSAAKAISRELPSSLGGCLRNELMSTISIGSGLICAAAIAMGSGFVIPVGATIGGLFDLVAIASGMVCFGLVDAN